MATSEIPVTAERSAVMRAVKSRGNASTEQRLIQILRRSKITGWRTQAKIFGSPDLVFPGPKIAVMIHGCFWHGCRYHYRPPKTNVEYWSKKVERNMIRDKLVQRALRSAGWSVLTFWEHDLHREHVVAGKIQRKIAQKSIDST